MLKNLTFLLFILPAALFAQTITGKVVSKNGKKAVPDASVFLSNASVGSKTADDGSFILNNIKNGQYDLVVSCIGFETYHQSVMINNDGINLPVIELSPKTTVLQEVKILFDGSRDRYVKIFTEEFLGRSENAAECKLINPELLDLDFDKRTGKLTASTTDFLIIENQALGYRIKYLLKSFTRDPTRGYIAYQGSSIFEPLTGKESQQKRWQKARIKAYRGSDMHFLRACIAQQVDEEGFTVRRLIRKSNADRPPDSLIKAKLTFFRGTSPFTAGRSDSIQYWSGKSMLAKYIQTLVKAPISSRDYIKLTQKKGIYAFGYEDCLQINYKGDRSTVVIFNTPYAYFDSNGIIYNPDSHTVEGYWGTLRIADLLPVDYELPTTF
jgi:hypothetical protein